jgi:hypothetical protein
MRAYIAVALLTAGLVAPALAETAPSLVNVQQPNGERAAQPQRQKTYRHAAAARATQAKQTRITPAASARMAQSGGPTRIVPGNQITPAASSSSSWSSSMLSWWRGDSTPPGAGQATEAQVAAEPAAARVETTGATTEPVKPTTRRKLRRPRSSEPTATGAVPETSQAEVKVEKPTRSKRRSAKRSRSRDRQVAARASTARQADKSRDNVPPEPRPKPVNSATQDSSPRAAADSAVGSISPAETKKSGGSQMAALSSEAAGGEATWWQRQGNPVVFNFRDCVASYASREAQHSKDGTWADLLIRATEGDCRAPFDEMARTLAKRFGEARIEPVMRELIDTTFLPAAKQAAAESAPAATAPSSAVPPLPPIPDNVPTQ